MTLLAAAAAIGAGPASAATYLFAFQGTTGPEVGTTFAGTFTTNGTAANGYLKIDTLSGTQTTTVGGATLGTLSLLAAGTFPTGSGYANDNLLNPDPLSSDAYVDGYGLGFRLTSGTVTRYYDLFPVNGPNDVVGGTPGTYNYVLCSSTGTTGCSAYSNARVVITPNVAPVPETATWAMLVAGVGAAGVALRRRRRSGPRVSPAR